MAPVKFHFINQFWGETYVDEFLKVSLPCQLSEGNLGSFYNRSCGDKYKIYTNSNDAKTIEKAPIFSRLTEIIDTEIHTIDDVWEEVATNRITKYDVMNICQSRGIEDAIKEQAAFVPILADHIFSDGSFANLIKIASKGKRLVMIGGHRVAKETFVPEVLEKFYSPDDHCISIPSHELVRLFVTHLHPEIQILFPESPRFYNGWPSHLFWRVRGEGLLIRGFHLIPIMFNPSSTEAQPFSPVPGVNEPAIDGGDYMMQVVPDFNDVYVVDDSEEIACVSLHELDDSYKPPPTDKFSPFLVASWIKKHCCAYHVNFVKTKIRFHATDLSPQWEEVERRSDEIVDSIFPCLEFLEKVPDAQNQIQALKEELDDTKGKCFGLMNQLRALTTELEKLRLDDAAAHIRLGVELKNQGKVNESVEAFKRAIKLAPRDPVPYNQLGIALYQFKKVELAEKILHSAIKVCPTHVDTYVNLAGICSDQGRYAETIAYLKQAAKHAPNDIEVLTALGTLGMKLGDDEAVQIALQCFRIVEPSHCIIQTLEKHL